MKRTCGWPLMDGGQTHKKKGREHLEPIIFLDVDGVLNSGDYFVSLKGEGRLATIEEHIDPKAVDRLNRICEATGARIVVSSTWRRGKLYEILLRMLRQHGFTGEIIGVTGERGCDDCVRGNQIYRWMKDNVPEYWAFTAYLILDDDADMLYWQRNNFIKTDGLRGLTDVDAVRAISILRSETSAEPMTRIKLPSKARAAKDGGAP